MTGITQCACQFRDILGHNTCMSMTARSLRRQINYNDITSPASNDGDDDEEFASSIGSVIQLYTNIYHILEYM